jgi:CubicO group peptidase (beta-lactamase class C family)
MILSRDNRPFTKMSAEASKLARLPSSQSGEKFHTVDWMSWDIYRGYLGMPFDVFLQKRLFRPRICTWFYLPQDKAKLFRAAKGNGNGPCSYFLRPDYPSRSRRFCSGGAGLSSTARIMPFLQMYLNGGRWTGYGY